MKRLILTSAVLSLASAMAFADIVAEGTVVDAQGEPLVGATVRVPGTNIAIPADIDGHFRLRVPDQAKELRIDYIGYKPQTLRVRSHGRHRSRAVRNRASGRCGDAVNCTHT